MRRLRKVEYLDDLPSEVGVLAAVHGVRLKSSSEETVAALVRQRKGDFFKIAPKALAEYLTEQVVRLILKYRSGDKSAQIERIERLMDRILAGQPPRFRLISSESSIIEYVAAIQLLKERERTGGDPSRSASKENGKEFSFSRTQVGEASLPGYDVGRAATKKPGSPQKGPAQKPDGFEKLVKTLITSTYDPGSQRKGNRGDQPKRKRVIRTPEVGARLHKK
ncbi:MAG TPA: hypothetical protein PKY51_01780 [Fimbriimonadaceae bacterium]|nr:hypothetical protein [Fimbriimonadaceae bacterium]